MKTRCHGWRPERAAENRRRLGTPDPLPQPPSPPARHDSRWPWWRSAKSAGPLAVLAGYLAGPGPVPARGVAMVSLLLADGARPLTHQASAEDLGDLIDKAAAAPHPVASAACPSSSS